MSAPFRRLALRPFLAADTPLLAAIFAASVEELTGDDYDAGQQAAWAALADDETAFAERLAGQLTLIATMDGAPVAFASLRGNDHIDMLYVHPAVARQGVATSLVDALEKLARARGAAKLTVDASDTAKAFFDKLGYVAQQRNAIAVGTEWLGNVSMQKPLPTAQPESKIQ
jgi:putative acetyltransferase